MNKKAIKTLLDRHFNGIATKKNIRETTDNLFKLLDTGVKIEATKWTQEEMQTMCEDWEMRGKDHLR